MSEILSVGFAGAGRMGWIHGLHLAEMIREGAAYRPAAVADSDIEKARQLAAGFGWDVPVFGSIEELAKSGLCQFSVVTTATIRHHEHALEMIRAGHRILLEKPLTATIDGDKEICAELDRAYPDSLMLAFQRRFDAPLLHAKQMIDSGLIGRIYKINSWLDDSEALPLNYEGAGILADTGVHNIDEVLWLSGAKPKSAASVCSRIHALLPRQTDDFDDAQLFIWMDNGLLAQIQVSRNHVSGYHNETVIYGEHGMIQVGRFEQKPLDVSVTAYGPKSRSTPLDQRDFKMTDYHRSVPEFMVRYGPAYKNELGVFLECCRTGSAFSVTHRDGLHAQLVVEAAARCQIGSADAALVSG
jgi:predicted dehydrogenase